MFWFVSFVVLLAVFFITWASVESSFLEKLRVIRSVLEDKTNAPEGKVASATSIVNEYLRESEGNQKR